MHSFYFFSGASILYLCRVPCFQIPKLQPSDLVSCEKTNCRSVSCFLLRFRGFHLLVTPLTMVFYVYLANLIIIYP